MEELNKKWNTFKNGEYGFEIKFPTGYKLSQTALEVEDFGALLVVTPEKNVNKLPLQKWFEWKLKNDKILNEMISSDTEGKNSLNDTVINGYKAIMLKNLNEGMFWAMVFISDNSKRIFSITAHSKDISENKTVEQILFSFKLGK
jgi:predicted Zn-dependent protease